MSKLCVFLVHTQCGSITASLYTTIEGRFLHTKIGNNCYLYHTISILIVCYYIYSKMDAHLGAKKLNAVFMMCTALFPSSQANMI